MSYAIFRVNGINTLKDLGQIGAHNERLKQAYNSNPDIKIELTQNNIDLVPCGNKYCTEYMKFVKPYKEQHDLKMLTERDDRKRSFNEMLDKSNSVVADELLFTSDQDFFQDMNKEDIINWGKTNLDFVYNILGYKKEQVLHATIHLDEKTPHVHCIVVPLINKYDKRSNCNKWTISKKQYIKDKIHLSELQDKYYDLMTSKGYYLERGIKGSNNEHINIKEYKKITKKITNELDKKSTQLNESINEFEEKIKTNKETILDKEYVKVKKETFESMNKVIKNTRKVVEMQPKIEKLYNEVDNYSSSYKDLENEIIKLKKENYRLKNIIEDLKENIDYFLNIIKTLFKRIFRIGKEKDKDYAIDKLKEIYDSNLYQKEDLRFISKGTTRESELEDYIEQQYNLEDKEI
jgi:NADH:ubiquinone oxidoreductase subunit C